MILKEAFKLGFLMRCAELGLNEEQTRARIKAASAKQASGAWSIPSEIVEAFGRLGPMAATSAAVLGIGGPVAAGAAGGYGLAKLREDDVVADEIKSDELLAEYQRLTEHAQRQAQLRRMQAQNVPQRTRRL